MSSNATPARAGTKATAPAVFAACEKLRAEKGDFSNEDVLAITGGSLSTVIRYRRLYSAHEEMILANQALDAATSVSLVQALDNLLHEEKERSQSAVNRFIENASAEIQAAEEELARSVTALNESESSLRQTREELEIALAENVRLAAALESEEHEKLHAQDALNEAQNELEALEATHAAKLEEYASLSQRELTSALESQRKTMEQEKREALTELRAELTKQHEQALIESKSASAELEKRIVPLQKELDDIKGRYLTKKDELKAAQSENRSLLSQIAQQEAVMIEHREVLAKTQASHKDIISALEKRHEPDPTESVSEVLKEVRNLSNVLQDLRKSNPSRADANLPKSP